MAKKKKRPPKPTRPKREKKYNPRRQSDDDYGSGSGLMQGITRSMKRVAGTEETPTADGGLQLGSVVLWALVAAAAAFAVYRFVT